MGSTPPRNQIVVETGRPLQVRGGKDERARGMAGLLIARRRPGA